MLFSYTSHRFAKVVTVNLKRLKLGQQLPFVKRNRDRNLVCDKLWLSTKTKKTKKDPSTSSKNNPNREAKALTSSSSTNVTRTSWGKKHLPRFMHEMMSPNNKTMTKPMLFDSSAAVICGHAAFVLTGMAYLTKDILHLRILAMMGISTSMIFQFYRPQPLNVPLRWNTLFLLINCVMAGFLVQDRLQAEDMNEEWKEIYECGMFEKRGFRKVDFFRLFRLAKKEVRKKGDYLKRAGVLNNELCYIVDGEAAIKRDGSSLAWVSKHDFTGEIEFMRFMTANEDISSEEDSNKMKNTLSNQINDESSNSSSIAHESIVVESEVVTLYVFEFDKLKSMLAKDHFLSNALLAYVSHELREKLAWSWEMKVASDKEKIKMEQLAVDYLMEGLKK